MLVAIDQARLVLEQRAAALGFPPERAALLADHLLDAELCGASSHGAERMRWLAGFAGLRPEERARREQCEPGLSRYAAAGALGYLALADAIDAELAEPVSGARIVVVTGCFPSGRLGYFAERVARAGRVCLLCASSPSRLSHPAGGGPILGTNPFCLALPDEPEPFVIDVSMGRITYGDVLEAAAAGNPLPPDAAIGPDGAPEADPAAVIAAVSGILPFGGEQAYKGFALALIVELLAAALGNGDSATAVLVMAQPRADPLPEIRERAAGLRLPGVASMARRREALRQGTVELPDGLWEWLTNGR
jgi:L-2-hydroxycarboxylate dehydrogenase (NAD+)